MALLGEIRNEQAERGQHRRNYHKKDRQLDAIHGDLKSERRLIVRLEGRTVELTRELRLEAERDATNAGLHGEPWELRVAARLDEIPGLIGVTDHHIDVLLVTLADEAERRRELRKLIKADDARIDRLRDRRERRREDRDGDVSRYFHLVEFSCKCWGANLIPQDRMRAGIERHAREVLDPFRERFGPTAITSPWRTGHNCGCPKPGYDASVGGVGGNHVYEEHLKAPATDLIPVTAGPGDWASWGRTHCPGGVGYYPRSRFVHLDPRMWEGRPRAYWVG